MAKDEPPSPGLLSKMAKFVRNPTKDWSELDQKEPEQESGYSKEVLKEMIERKRQNDFVRKREFDQLRKIRRREVSGSSESAGRPSFFQSSLPSNDGERAETIKKIDEIEAQMSRQWWKGKQTGQAPLDVRAQQPDSPAANADTQFAPTQASILRPNTDASAAFSPTQLGHAETVAGPNFGMVSMPPTSSVSSRSAPDSMGGSTSTSSAMGAGFSTSKLFAAEPAENMADPDLEEAAIRFANGDDSGAESGLMAALGKPGVATELAEVWMFALFDLYRMTGQKDRFDSFAIDFASRYARSAPVWFSAPEMLGRTSHRASSSPDAKNSEPLSWVCPQELSLDSLAQLLSMQQQSQAELRLDWRLLKTLSPEVLGQLAAVFAHWCESTQSLRFSGSECLDRALKSITPSGEKRISPLNWQLRMDALRVMCMQDEFELVALEYCVTYEVSPPSWQTARSNCVFDGTPVAAAAAQPAVVNSDSEENPMVELTGEIAGDAADALKSLRNAMDDSNQLVVSCARLIRVDFSAAGSILNWVAARQAEGCKIQFREVNRMVAAFFSVIGIQEHALVVTRNN